MRKHVILCLTVILHLHCLSQYNNYYFLQGQQKSITYSSNIMVVQFGIGLSNAQKQTLLTTAQVDLLHADWNNIPQVVRLHSRILSRQVLFYPPCDSIPPVDPRVGKGNTGITSDGKDLCLLPPHCCPYNVTQYYDNFEDALNYFLLNTNIRSASKAIITNVSSISGTCEDIFIKIKSTNSINDFSSLMTLYNFTSTDMSSKFGPNVYKISTTREDSRYCVDRSNMLFNSGMCDFATPNFREFIDSLLTTDPYWSDQWNMLNTGQNNGTIGADIRIMDAWSLSKGNNIKIAVSDEGVYLPHRDLVGNLVTGLDLTARH